MYRTGFQCPSTGLWIIARYQFGKVILRTADYSGDREAFDNDEDFNAAVSETERYCKRYTNRRCRNIDEADRYIIRVSDGQSDGFERM